MRTGDVAMEIYITVFWVVASHILTGQAEEHTYLSSNRTTKGAGFLRKVDNHIQTTRSHIPQNNVI
jgi:hypothetical protein